MEDKQKMQQDRSRERKKRRVRNQILVYIGVFAFVAAIVVATVPGIRHLFRGEQAQTADMQGSQIPEESSSVPKDPLLDVNSPTALQHAESMKQTLAEKRPALVTIKGSADGANYTNGSGFILEIRDDVLFICTCGHVIESLDSWEVGFYDGTTAEGIKTGVSQVYDVGIVEVSLGQLPAELIQNLFAISIDTEHWSSLEGQIVSAGFVSMYQAPGSDSYMAGVLLNILEDYPWGDLSHSEFQLTFEDGDSGSAIFDESGMLISMVYGSSFEGTGEGIRQWGVPLSGIMTSCMEIMNLRDGM